VLVFLGPFRSNKPKQRQQHLWRSSAVVGLWLVVVALLLVVSSFLSRPRTVTGRASI
jgi:flagellar biosynthesis/type III secretory pathway M-ring protein FliF/YscJ